MSNHVPKGWREVTVDDIKGMGQTALATGPFGSSIGSRFFVESGVPLIRGSNLDNDAKTHLIENDFVFLCEAKAAEFRRAQVCAGDLVFTCWGTINQVGLISNRANYPAYIISNKQMKLTPDPKKTNSTFLFYLFSGPEVQRQIVDQTIGSSVPGFNLGRLRALRFCIPGLAEQEAIAQALGNADSLVESLQHLLAKKRDVKQGAMQQLLTGNKRLPGFSGSWTVKQVREMVQTPVTDGPHLTPRFLNDGIPFLSVNNLVRNRIDLTELRFVSAADHEIFSRKCKPRKGDVLLGKAASVGKVAIVSMDVEFNIWSPIALIRVCGDISPLFVYYQFQTANLIRQISLLTNSSSQGNIGMGEIERLTFKLPTIEEQVAIAAVLADIDAEIDALEAKLAKARQIKQGMMQELLTGRIRLV